MCTGDHVVHRVRDMRLRLRMSFGDTRRVRQTTSYEQTISSHRRFYIHAKEKDFGHPTHLRNLTGPSFPLLSSRHREAKERGEAGAFVRAAAYNASYRSVAVKGGRMQRLRIFPFAGSPL
jgi:hypothetical protein